MDKSFSTSKPLSELGIWDNMIRGRRPMTFDLEITARCNNNCRHCYINLPPDDRRAIKDELSLKEIERIAKEAVSLGAVWCLITGGEPLLRKDFPDIYLSLKKAGLLVSVFTNATLITEEHVRLFKKYPPRDIEITVYGVTDNTYGRMTRNPASFRAFRRGLGLLLKNNINVRLKAMATRSNFTELAAIKRFCKPRTKDYFRVDPLLHLRFDRDRERNEEIKSERLSAGEITLIDASDPERMRALKKECGKLVNAAPREAGGDNIFICDAGNNSFAVSPSGLFHICAGLWHPDCLYDLRKGSLSEAWEDFTPGILKKRSGRKEFLENCRVCPLMELCMWCPAHSYLETGRMDTLVNYFCGVARARASNLFLSLLSMKAP